MDLQLAQQTIESARRTLIVSHVRPDGDAVGCAAALAGWLAALAAAAGRDGEVRTLFLSPVPDNYRFLLADEPWLLGRDIDAEQIDAGALDAYDLIVIVDTSSRVQLPGLGDYLSRRTGPVLVVDHHPPGDTVGTISLIDSRAAATGQILFELAAAAGWPLDAGQRDALFVAIATDTGWFRFSNTSGRTLAIAAALVDAGARPDELFAKVYQDYPPQRLYLLGLTLQTLELLCGNRLAVMRISRAMLESSGADSRLIENIVNEPLQIGSVEVSLLLVEQADGAARASLRSRGAVDVNAVACRFGGGGHAQAAGVSLQMPLEQARQVLIDALNAALT